jgi:hypothetical protein
VKTYSRLSSCNYGVTTLRPCDVRINRPSQSLPPREAETSASGSIPAFERRRRHAWSVLCLGGNFTIPRKPAFRWRRRPNRLPSVHPPKSTASFTIVCHAKAQSMGVNRTRTFTLISELFPRLCMGYLSHISGPDVLMRSELEGWLSKRHETKADTRCVFSGDSMI